MPPKVESVPPSEISKMHLQNMTDICPCNTASLSDTRQSFYPLNIHRIFGCFHFHNLNQITSAANNATLVDTRKPPTTLGAFAFIPKSNKGK